MRLGPQPVRAALVFLVSLHHLEVLAPAVGCLTPSQRKTRMLPAGRLLDGSGGIAHGKLSLEFISARRISKALPICLRRPRKSKRHSKTRFLAHLGFKLSTTASTTPAGTFGTSA
jgi:hypothetical protein